MTTQENVTIHPAKARIVTRFDERKTAAAAAVLLKEAGGQMPYLRLIKILYLADRESWLTYNRPITGDKYVSMNYGPVLSKTYDLIRGEGEEAAGPWANAIERDGPNVKLKAEPDLGPLSEAELDVLTEAYRLTETIDRWKLAELTHAFPEWQDPQGSSIPIRPEDILGALGKSEEEIDQARRDAAEREHFDELFGA